MDTHTHTTCRPTQRRAHRQRRDTTCAQCEQNLITDILRDRKRFLFETLPHLCSGDLKVNSVQSRRSKEDVTVQVIDIYLPYVNTAFYLFIAFKPPHLHSHMHQLLSVSNLTGSHTLSESSSIPESLLTYTLTHQSHTSVCKALATNEPHTPAYTDTQTSISFISVCVYLRSLSVPPDLQSSLRLLNYTLH